MVSNPAETTAAKAEKIPFSIRAAAATIAKPQKPNEEGEPPIKRENQDACFSDPERGRFGLFDGMGGYAGGAKAAAMASAHIQKRLAEISPDEEAKNVADRVNDALKEANEKVLDEQERNPELSAMGTTASLVVICPGGRAVIGNAGDSRVYVYRRGRTAPLSCETLDDGFARDLYKKDLDKARSVQQKLDNLRSREELDKELGLLYSHRHIITNGLGSKRVTPRVDIIDIEEGDVILLTTDGVHDNLTFDQIQDIASKHRSPEELSQALTLEASQTRGFRFKEDDITAVAVSLEKSTDRSELKPETIKLRENSPSKLFRNLRDIGTIEGSGGTYEPEELITDITKCLRGELRDDDITRSHGVRQRVTQMLNYQKELLEGLSRGEKIFEAAQNKQDLLDQLFILGKLSGTEQEYDYELLERLIDRALTLDDQPSIEKITRTGGLRDAVIRLKGAKS